MPEQALQYATTVDGVRIAIAVTGQGHPLVHMPNEGVSSLLLDRALPVRREWAGALSRRFTLVRYDWRAHGLSQRDVEDLSWEAGLVDLHAVVDKLGLERFALFGFLGSSSLAPVFAARHPERVSHLILWPPDTREQSSEEYRALGQLARSDWETFTETYAHLAMGWEQGEAAHRYAEIMRESITHETYLRLASQPRSLSRVLAESAPDVRAPTLIVQRRLRYAADRVARMAAAFPDSRLILLDGNDTLPYLGNVDEVVETMAAFVNAGEHREASATPVAKNGVGFTERETEVLALLAKGLSNQEIADTLVLSVRTVERHLSRIYDKIGAFGKSARAAAATYARPR